MTKSASASLPATTSYIAVLTFGSPLQPLLVRTGREEAAATFGVGIHL